MSKNRLMVASLGLMLILALSGCLDIFALPNVAVSTDGQWAAFLQMNMMDNDMALYGVNVNDGSQVRIGAEGDWQGAFDWHPDQAQIAYYNVSADGAPTIRVSDIGNPSEGTDAFGAFAFPGPFWATQIAYSPNGQYLAISAIMLPEGTNLRGDVDLFSGPDDMMETQGAVYLADFNNGTVTAISDPDAVFPSTLEWSPDSNKIAYVGWYDGNEDGNIDFSGAGMFEAMFGAGDIADVYVYDVGSQSTSAIDDGNLNYSPSWLNDSSLAYVSFVLNLTSPEQGVNIKAYDVNGGNTSLLVEGGDNSILGVSASPDGSQIAYISSPSSSDEMMTGGVDEGGETEPVNLMVANADGSDARLVFQGDENTPFVDVPVWSPDGSTLFVSSANPLMSMFGGLAVGLDEEFGGEDATEDLNLQQLTLINVASGEATVLYEGGMASSGIIHFAFSLASSGEDFGFEE